MVRGLEQEEIRTERTNKPKHQLPHEGLLQAQSHQTLNVEALTFVYYHIHPSVVFGVIIHRSSSSNALLHHSPHFAIATANRCPPQDAQRSINLLPP